MRRGEKGRRMSAGREKKSKTDGVEGNGDAEKEEEVETGKGKHKGKGKEGTERTRRSLGRK